MGKLATVAYLAPELPALSATFVYEELLALERCGVSVLPISVRVPTVIAKEQTDLLSRCLVVYDRTKWRIALDGLLHVIFQPGASRSLRWLLHDLSAGHSSDLAWKLIFQFLAAVKVAKVLRQKHILHIHIHFAHVPTNIGMYAAAMAEIPFTVIAHANDIFERGFLLHEKAQRAKKFLTISEYNCLHLLQLGLPSEKLAVVRCGVSIKIPDKLPKHYQKAVFRIGTLGRLVEKKGVDVLLRSLSGLQDVQVVIAGDGPLRTELEGLACDLGMASRVEFLGNLSHREVANWLVGLDVFVLACKQDRNGDMDGIPVVLMEAMSQGIPVVSTRLSGIPELVLDGETGLLAEPSDPDSLRKKITELLASAELRGKLAHAAAVHVNAEFSQHVNIERLLRLFDIK